MAEVTRADAEAQVRRTIGAYRDRVHEVRNDTDFLPPEGARIVDEYCSFDNDWQDLVLKATRETSFLGGMDDGLLLEYCAVCMELDGALGLDSWRIGRVDRIVGVADLSRSEKIKKAIEYSDVLGEILEEVGDINILAAQMAVVSGVLIGLAVSGYGAVAEVLGFALLAVGAAFTGTDLLAGIAGLVKFFTTVDEAKTEEDLGVCGRLFGDAVAKIGVDGLFFVMSMFGLRKASARLTTKTVADSSLNARKWKGKRIEERELKIEEVGKTKPITPDVVSENSSEILPNVEKAIINPKKLYDYALNLDHPVGVNKAKVFESTLGYNQSNAADLISQLYEKLPESKIILGKRDEYGQRYTIDINIQGINGKNAIIRTGWIIKTDSDTLELTTLYVKKD